MPTLHRSRETLTGVISSFASPPSTRGSWCIWWSSSRSGYAVDMCGTRSGTCTCCACAMHIHVLCACSLHMPPLLGVERLELQRGRRAPPLLLAPGPRPAFGPLRGCPRVKHRGAHGAQPADREEARGVEVEERHGDERAAHDGQCRGEALDNVVGVPSKCR